MALGLSEAGFEIQYAIDNELQAIQSYNLNVSNHGHVHDIREVSASFLCEVSNFSTGELDLFSGGPPCQGFSKQRRGAFLLDDPRNLLVRDFTRLVNDLQPKAFLFENVQIFGQKRGAQLISELKNALANYTVSQFHVCSTDFGLAQARGRFLMIGIRRDVSNSTPCLVASDMNRTVKDVIGDLPPPPNDCTSHPDFYNHLKCKISKENEERFSHVPQGGGWMDIPWEIRLPCHKTENPKTGGWPDVYGRLEWDGKCPTITGGFDSFSRGRYGHPEQNRAITPREAARFQGFPDEFNFQGNRADVRKQIGNAVPPPLAKAAGQAIKRVLNNEDFNESNEGRIIYPTEKINQYKLAV